jgi:hypothetical protein
MATTTSQQRGRSRRRSPASAARSARANGRLADAGAAAQERATNGAAEAGGRLHRVAGKAKRPALAGGAALAAIAGGVALAKNGRRSKGFALPSLKRKRSGLHLPHVSMPHLPHRSDEQTTDVLRATAKALGSAAVEIGKTGYRVGELAADVRRVREQAAHRDD